MRIPNYCTVCSSPMTCPWCNRKEATAPAWQWLLAMLLGAVLGIGGLGIAVIITSNPG